MGFIFQNLLLDVGALTACVIAVIYVYFKWSFTYWKKRDVPYIAPSFPFGNFSDTVLSRKSIGLTFVDLYKKLDGEKFGGTFTFTQPGFIFRDPEIIKNVLVKDFNHFQDRGFYSNEEVEPLTGHLFLLPGERWRNLRIKLTPTFTSGKMKMMFHTIVECGQELISTLEETASNEEILEVKDILARYTTDIIASCAFGIQCNCLKNADAEFRQWGRKIFESSIRKSITGFLSALAPTLLDVLKLRDLDPKISKYFRSMFENTVKYRELNNIKRNDFMHLLIQLKNNEIVKEENGILVQNGHENLEEKSVVKGMYFQRVL
jgi:cytochrome P450 family 6